MRARRLLILGITAVWLVVMALVAKLSIDRLSVSPWGNPIGQGLSAAVEGETQVGQWFEAPMPGLYRIEMMLVPGAGDSPYQVTYHLKRDPADAGDLWTGQFSSSEVQAGVPYGFEFGPIRDSQGQPYYFYLEAPGVAAGQGIAVRYGPESDLEGARAYLNGRPVAGNLQFKTYYSLRTRDRVGLLLGQMAEGRPYIFGSPAFYVALGVLYALVLLLFLWQVARVVLRETEEES